MCIRDRVGIESSLGNIAVHMDQRILVALLGVAVLITYSLQNGIILLVIVFLISPCLLYTS